MALRSEIAHRAARLIAEDHILDFAQAKKKAARQLGVTEGRALPSNQEIEAALESYRAIYQPDHAGHLDRLRGKALILMRLLTEFQPYLTGSVLSGVAGPHSDINLLIYTDDPKAVELFLLNRQIDYQIAEQDPLHRHADYPTLVLWYDDSAVKLHVRPLDAERNNPRRDDRERIRAEQLQALLENGLATADGSLLPA
ncbi:nucleotidyltransferase domain-containing protein [Andreprevotia lacus]|uniref:nucleotidyltransferase domain-containing protein n=1 Tax=Andreprevotia lacus TaxID=1121000 RepID=UPI001C385E16|nr:nucleotidyltransferase domain-containing protein [Andreprevotia lacus]